MRIAATRRMGLQLGASRADEQGMRSTSRWEFSAPLSAVSVRAGAPTVIPDSAVVASSEQELARRYLTEGRLRVHVVEGSRVEATVEGMWAERRLGHDEERGWWCSCGRGVNCAHLRALRLVTSDPSGPHG